nr:hypothetical protein [Tanacetum cinerariifolium]
MPNDFVMDGVSGVVLELICSMRLYDGVEFVHVLPSESIIKGDKIIVHIKFINTGTFNCTHQASDAKFIYDDFLCKTAIGETGSSRKVCSDSYLWRIYHASKLSRRVLMRHTRVKAAYIALLDVPHDAYMLLAVHAPYGVDLNNLGMIDFYDINKKPSFEIGSTILRPDLVLLSTKYGGLSYPRSSISEFGVLGFELEYSMENPNSLVKLNLVIFQMELRDGTGYDGQVPERSSARLERFLQMSDDNAFVIPEMEPIPIGKLSMLQLQQIISVCCVDRCRSCLVPGRTNEHGLLQLHCSTLVSFNLSLLLKWRWRFVHNDNMLWVRVIKHIYGQQGGFESSTSRVTDSNPRSRLIVATFRLINHHVIDTFVLKKHVGNGASTRFWEDLWLDNQLLSSRFPRLYALENFKNIAISDRWNGVAWFWQWRREVRGWVEQTQLDGLSALLENVTLSSERDRWWWSLDPNGIFSVKQTRQWIYNVVLPSAQLSTRWNKLVPRKVNILIWRVLLDRIPTRLNLHNRDIDTQDILCPICKLHTEHSTHLFIGCEVAKSTWAAIGVWIELILMGVQYVVGLFSWLDSLNFN